MYIYIGPMRSAAGAAGAASGVAARAAAGAWRCYHYTIMVSCSFDYHVLLLLHHYYYVTTLLLCYSQ